MNVWFRTSEPTAICFVFPDTLPPPLTCLVLKLVKMKNPFFTFTHAFTMTSPIIFSLPQNLLSAVIAQEDDSNIDMKTRFALECLTPKKVYHLSVSLSAPLLLVPSIMHHFSLTLLSALTIVLHLCISSSLPLSVPSCVKNVKSL